MIGQHPEMYSLPEVNLFMGETYDDLFRLYRIRQGFQHGLLRAVAELGLGDQSVESVVAARRWLEEQSHLSTAVLFRDLAEWAHPRRLVDKSPSYVYGLESLVRIRSAFPGAHYLHLTRHPYATCQSVFKLRDDIRSRAAEAGIDLEARGALLSKRQRLVQVQDPETLWLRPHRNITEFLKDVPSEHWLRFRGEDILAKPDEYLAQIARWLGLDAGEDAIEAMKHPERSPFARYGPPNAKFGNDPSFLEAPALRPYQAKVQTLEGPLDGCANVLLSDEIKAHAIALGYADMST